MTSKELKKYFDVQISSFFRNYSEILKRASKKDIHAFRLSIKRLRVFLWLVEVASDGDFSKKEHYLILSKLFRLAGKVRETQINMQLIKTFDRGKHGYAIERYSKTLKAHSKLFADELRKFPQKKFLKLNQALRHSIRCLSGKEFIKVVQRLLKNELKEIKKLNDNIVKMRDLHKLRIHLKKAKEIIIFLGRADVFKFPKQVRKDLRMLYEYLGIWHDHHILLCSLNSMKHKQAESKKVSKLNPTIKLAQQREEILRSSLRLQVAQQVLILKRYTKKKAAFIAK